MTNICHLSPCPISLHCIIPLSSPRRSGFSPFTPFRHLREVSQLTQATASAEFTSQIVVRMGEGCEILLGTRSRYLPLIPRSVSKAKDYLELGADAGWFFLLMEMEERFGNAVMQCQVSQVLERLHIQHVLWKKRDSICP